jgi:hypothetical protein
MLSTSLQVLRFLTIFCTGGFLAQIRTPSPPRAPKQPASKAFELESDILRWQIRTRRPDTTSTTLSRHPIHVQRGHDLSPQEAEEEAGVTVFLT